MALPPPFPLETGIPGVFAVGDVRHGSGKRVASAIGEGSIVVSMVYRYLEALLINPTGRKRTEESPDGRPRHGGLLRRCPEQQ